MDDMDDIVIEFKVRLSGLDYDQAQQVRDVLRNQRDESTVFIVDEIRALAQEIAPDANVRWSAPWSEWRPARGRRSR
jgi:hypothetical protein